MDYPASGAFNVPATPSDLLAEDMAALLEQTTGAARQAVGGRWAETLSIAAGVIAPSFGTVRVDTEAAAATDDLTHIQTTNMRSGGELLLWAQNTGHVVTVKSGAGGVGQIITADGEDYVLDTDAKCLRLQLRSSGVWLETSRAFEVPAVQVAQQDRIDLLGRFVLRLFGGSDGEATGGVILYSPVGDNSMKCVATDPASMVVTVMDGAGYVDGEPFDFAEAASAAMSAPYGASRYDGIFVEASTGEVVVVNGTESGSPTPPSVAPDGCLLVAHVFHRVGSVSISDTDDAVNSYILDARVKING